MSPDARAESALNRAVQKDASSTKGKAAQRLLNQLAAARRAAKEEADRRSRLGFAVLTPTSQIQFAEGTARATASRGKRWIFDRYDDYWRYREAVRGSTFLSADVTIQSKSHYPVLPGLIAVRLERGVLRRLTTFEYQFFRWEDYGSYLGNEADSGNSFAHTARIRFSLGAEVPESAFRGAPVFVLATKAGCADRATNPFATPETYYRMRATCLAAENLKLEQVLADYTVIHVFNRHLLE